MRKEDRRRVSSRFCDEEKEPPPAHNHNSRSHDNRPLSRNRPAPPATSQGLHVERYQIDAPRQHSSRSRPARRLAPGDAREDLSVLAAVKGRELPTRSTRGPNTTLCDQ